MCSGLRELAGIHMQRLAAQRQHHDVFGVLRTCFFRPERTWGNYKKPPGNAGANGNITICYIYLHMSAYPVFLSPRLKAGSACAKGEKATEN